MILKNKFIIYFLFIASIFLGFFLEENASGGAKIDYEFLKTFIIEFSRDFTLGLNLFVSNPGSFIHSPFFYIISGYLVKIFNNIFFVKIFYILVCSILPYIFYLVLKIKYKINYEYLFYISIIIFLSPYFRTSAIWLLGDNLSIIFFLFSILFYLKTFEDKKNTNNYYLCIIFLILCCYIRYYYFLFIFYYLFDFYNKIKLKDFIKIIFVSFILSIPEIIYLIHIIYNHNYISFISKKADGNYFTNFIIILTILLFYLIPFFYTKFIKIFKFYKENFKILISILIICTFILILDKYLFDFINFDSNLGGGVFIKLLKILNLDFEIILISIFGFSILIIDYIFKGNRVRNYILLLLLVLCFPMPIIYQKYLDPLFFIIFFGLIKSDIINNMFINKEYNLIMIYTYFGSFFLFSTLYYKF